MTSHDRFQCPACSGTSSVQVGRPATAFSFAFAGRTLEHPPYAIRCCEDCGLYFKSHTMPVELLEDYYEHLDEATFELDGNYPTDRIVRDALARLPERSRVLDFGCSTGRILKTLTGRLECFGVEPNTRAAAVSRGRGIRILSEPELQDHGGFDAIILADVYEHLPRPAALLDTLVSRMTPGAWLAIVTGNADAITTRELIGEYWYFRSPSHLLMLSERHLSWLANRWRLQVAAVHSCSHYNIAPAERAWESLRASVYYQFRLRPDSRLTAVLRRIPYARRAARWSNAPALLHTRDHVVAILQKPR